MIYLTVLWYYKYSLLIWVWKVWLPLKSWHWQVMRSWLDYQIGLETWRVWRSWLSLPAAWPSSQRGMYVCMYTCVVTRSMLTIRCLTLWFASSAFSVISSKITGKDHCVQYMTCPCSTLSISGYYQQIRVVTGKVANQMVQDWSIECRLLKF